MTIAREKTKQRRFREKVGYEPTHRNKSMWGEISGGPVPGPTLLNNRLRIHQEAVAFMATPMQKRKKRMADDPEVGQGYEVSYDETAVVKTHKLPPKKKPGFFKGLWNKLKSA